VFDLLSKYRRVVTGITYIQMGVVAEPWHVDREQRWQRRWSGLRWSLIEKTANAGRLAPSRD
jgi:hypothetical protein